MIAHCVTLSDGWTRTIHPSRRVVLFEHQHLDDPIVENGLTRRVDRAIACPRGKFDDGRSDGLKVGQGVGDAARGLRRQVPFQIGFSDVVRRGTKTVNQIVVRERERGVNVFRVDGIEERVDNRDGIIARARWRGWLRRDAFGRCGGNRCRRFRRRHRDRCVVRAPRRFDFRNITRQLPVACTVPVACPELNVPLKVI